MKLLWPSFIYIFTCIFSCYNNVHFVSSLCLDHQKSLLLAFKNTLEFNQSHSFNLVTWNESTDCCHWGGIACDPSNGQVISLDLLGEGITSVGSFSSLFQMQMASLTSLDLSSNQFDAILPNSIGNLKRLKYLDLSQNNFFGIIPSSIGSLNQLELLDLSFNNFLGPIPNSIFQLKALEELHLDDNRLNGTLHLNEILGPLKNLTQLYLSNNRLSIDTSGGTSASTNSSFPQLRELWLASCNLEGPIPKSIFQLRALEVLDLSDNRFSGTLHLNEILGPLKNLTHLYLSNNWLSIDTSGGTSASTNSSFPQLYILGLGSCNLGVLPEFLKTQSRLVLLDLSNNHIQGTVPTWIWNTSIDLNYLNLSGNNFVHLQQPIPSSSISDLDLHSNNIQGELPSLPFEQLLYLDLSSNGFTSINPDFGSNLSYASLSLARNDIYGRIPASLCNATNKLIVLNLEDNHFQGTMPDCLISRTPNLAALSVKGNNLSGVVPDNFEKGCMLQTLDLNGNLLQGRVPKSLAHCNGLEVLDVGNNQFEDTFPCELSSLPSLRVLILRSNNFFGSVFCPDKNSMWPLLQILDLASNHFSGDLRLHFVLFWKSMIAGINGLQSQPDQLHAGDLGALEYYQDAVTLAFKGNEIELQKILTIFTTIDLSNNAFRGEIPRELGNLSGLLQLNLSHNFLSGNIPSSFGNMRQLESLDLSYNTLSGSIPKEFSNLNFLGYLNLSFNKLKGPIPISTQLQSFDASSYQGNEGLYGPPLTSISKSSTGQGVPLTVSSDESNWSSKSEVEWMLRGAEVGFPVGLTIFIGPLLYIKRWRQWYCEHLEGLIMKVLHREDNARGRRRARRRSNMRQQLATGTLSPNQGRIRISDGKMLLQEEA